MKLCQAIAVANNRKTAALKKLRELAHRFNNPGRFEGITRTYRPKDEDGEQLPPEIHRVEQLVTNTVEELLDASLRLSQLTSSIDIANTAAKADLVVDGHTLAADVPVTTLLGLEKSLGEIANYLNDIPTLDTTEDWEFDTAAGLYKTSKETSRTKKIPRNHVKAEATEYHPAQVEVYTEDVIVGYWTTTKASGAMPQPVKEQLLRRVREVTEAVKMAREEANQTPADQKINLDPLFDYILGE